MNSTGVTDDQGRFTLTCLFKNEPGAVAGKHRVVVTDPPPSREMRNPENQRWREPFDFGFPVCQ